MPPHIVSEKQFPKVYAWISRFRAALDEAQASSAPKVVTLHGDAATDFILQSDFTQSGGTVDGGDPLGLKAGTEVEVYPSDWASAHRDSGRLIALAPDEVTIAAQSGGGGQEVHIHAPRTGFKVTEIAGSSTRV